MQVLEMEGEFQYFLCLLVRRIVRPRSLGVALPLLGFHFDP
jgi:hypothetical protein